LLGLLQGKTIGTDLIIAHLTKSITLAGSSLSDGLKE